MFCVKCGTELPDDANFCLKCGKVLKATVQAEPERQIQWEEKEFSELFSPVVVYKQTPSVLDQNALIQQMRNPIQVTTQKLLQRARAEGWEPTEPTDPGRLFLNGRIVTKAHYGGSFGNCKWELLEVNVNCRRQVGIGINLTEKTKPRSALELNKQIEQYYIYINDVMSKYPLPVRLMTEPIIKKMTGFSFGGWLIKTRDMNHKLEIEETPQSEISSYVELLKRMEHYIQKELARNDDIHFKTNTEKGIRLEQTTEALDAVRELIKILQK